MQYVPKVGQAIGNEIAEDEAEKADKLLKITCTDL